MGAKNFCSVVVDRWFSDDGSSPPKTACESLNYLGRVQMVLKRRRTIASMALAISVLFISASLALAQSQAGSTSTGNAGATGQKMKIKGVVTGRDGAPFFFQVVM